MKQLCCLFIAWAVNLSIAQNSYHVFPTDNNYIRGSELGDGSLAHPWDLKTALQQNSDKVRSGDTIWIHEGVYNGRFKSSLNSKDGNRKIVVSAFKDETVVLNGNTTDKAGYVLQVEGSNVIYKNFIITFLGHFSRTKSDADFQTVVGLNHIKGEDCEFRNLRIYDVPGSGIGSWKATGGTRIEDCIIYNNGYIGSRGHGVGIYVQNENDKTRIIRNNIIFNSYYKGIEVWSATSGTNRQFVKNVNLEDNIIFNNGMPFGKHVDNIIIASNDNEGINLAKNINVNKNILYHNIEYSDYNNFGYGASLTLGFNSRAPVENVSITNNYILGKNNALNMLSAKSLIFKNNYIRAGYVHIRPVLSEALKTDAFEFNENIYFTRRYKAIRILKTRDFTLKEWQDEFNQDELSTSYLHKDFDLQIVKVSPVKSVNQTFNIAILNNNENEIAVDLSDYGLTTDMTYTIYDIENLDEKVLTRKYVNGQPVKFPMDLSEFKPPYGNDKAIKSASNFNVFRIVFSEPKQRKGLLARFFKWLF